MGDFLKKDVVTPYCGCYHAAGVRLTIETNSEAVLDIARANFNAWDSDSGPQDDVRLRLWVEDQPLDDARSRPFFRGLGHLVFSGYGDRSSLVINLRDRHGAGRLTRTLALDERYWKTVLFPSLLAIVAPTVGLTCLHSACVASKNQGLLLVGDAGAGKSSLSLALAQTGFDFLSDDRTLVGIERGRLTAWGLSGEMKQRRDAIAHFPELENLECREIWRGDSVYRFDPAQILGVSRIPSCEPQWIVFLERQSDHALSLEEIASSEAACLLQRDLHQETPEATELQRVTIESLSRKACYVLRFGGNPHVVAGALRHLFLNNANPGGRASRPAGPAIVRTPAPASDPLRRFRATCLRVDTHLMGRHIRIETDNPGILARVTKALGRSEAAAVSSPQFVWRIVGESREESNAAWPAMTAFCDRSLRYISLGQYSFVAADLRAREAICVLSESLCEDDIGFPTVCLASMLHLSAPALGLTAVSAACVAKGQNGLLLFGPPNSGKTTASYWGRKFGLEFHSDQATFLESDAGAVRAWGDFWPVAFRPETTNYLPEIRTLARPFSYRDRSFLCVDRSSLSETTPGPVTPAACIFLERRASSPPRLIPLRHGEMSRQVFSDSGSDEDHRAILALLGRAPAYRLLYDEDPRIAARFFRSVLDAHQLMEQRA